MNFQTAIKTCFRLKFATTKGRASRSEYWWFTLLYVICLVSALLISILIMYGINNPDNINILDNIELITSISYMLMLPVGFVFFIPSVAVLIRRLHDINMSGRWGMLFLGLSFIPIISLIGNIVLIVLLCKSGTPGPNRFGNNPLHAADLDNSIHQTFE